MADAARMLPIFGVILFIIPLLWTDGGGETGGTRTATVMIYLFIVWAALTGISAVLSFRLGSEDDTPEDGASGGTTGVSTDGTTDGTAGEDVG